MLSAEYLNWACNQVIHNSSQDRGQFFHDLLRGYQRFGICADSEMPYAKKFLPNYRPSAQATNHALVIRSYGLRAQWIKAYDGTKGVSDQQLDAIKATLRKGWPVCAGSFHSVLLVGFTEDSAFEGGGGFYFRDSGAGNREIMSFKEAKARLCDVLWFDVEDQKSDSPKM